MNSLEKILADGFERIDSIYEDAFDKLDGVVCYEQKMPSMMKLFKDSFDKQQPYEYDPRQGLINCAAAHIRAQGAGMKNANGQSLYSQQLMGSYMNSYQRGLSIMELL